MLYSAQNKLQPPLLSRDPLQHLEYESDSWTRRGGSLATLTAQHNKNLSNLLIHTNYSLHLHCHDIQKLDNGQWPVHHYHLIHACADTGLWNYFFIRSFLVNSKRSSVTVYWVSWCEGSHFMWISIDNMAYHRNG